MNLLPRLRLFIPCVVVVTIAFTTTTSTNGNALGSNTFSSPTDPDSISDLHGRPYVFNIEPDQHLKSLQMRSGKNDPRRPPDWVLTLTAKPDLYMPIQAACTKFEYLLQHMLAAVAKLAANSPAGVSSDLAFQVGEFACVFRVDHTDETLLPWMVITAFLQFMLGQVEKGRPMSIHGVLGSSKGQRVSVDLGLLRKGGEGSGYVGGG